MTFVTGTATSSTSSVPTPSHSDFQRKLLDVEKSIGELEKELLPLEAIGYIGLPSGKVGNPLHHRSQQSPSSFVVDAVDLMISKSTEQSWLLSVPHLLATHSLSKHPPLWPALAGDCTAR